jgi:hypothetical protein
MTKNDSRMVVGLTTSGAETLAARLRKAHVVSAFSTAPSEVLFPVFEKRQRKTRPDLVFCGNHKGAKKTAAKLIRDVGFNPVDLGALSAARYIEPFSLLLAEIAYSGSAGPQLAYRFESLSVSAPFRPTHSAARGRPDSSVGIPLRSCRAARVTLARTLLTAPALAAPRAESATTHSPERAQNVGGDR